MLYHRFVYSSYTGADKPLENAFAQVSLKISPHNFKKSSHSLYFYLLTYKGARSLTSFLQDDIDEGTLKDSYNVETANLHLSKEDIVL